MPKPKKLVCDRCGEELSDKDDIELALDGTVSWHTFLKDRGDEPRGVFPCKNWIRCRGEMIDWKDRSNHNGHQSN